MTVRFSKPSPALVVLALICLCGDVLQAEDNAASTQNIPQLFATGLVGHSAILCDGEGNVLATNYRLPGTVGRIGQESGAKVLFEIPANMEQDEHTPLVGVDLDADGRVLALDSQQGRILRWNPETKMIGVVVDRFQGRRFDSLFGIDVGPGGNIYFSEPERTSGEAGSGSIYRYDVATNRPMLIAYGLQQPTGIRLSSNGKSLFVAEAGRTRVAVYDVEEDGTLKKVSTYYLALMLPAENLAELGRIGHITIDRRGWLYIALWDRGEIAVVDTKTGKLLETIDSGSDRVFGVALWQDALLMSVPGKEAIFRFDLRPLIGRHAP